MTVCDCHCCNIQLPCVCNTHTDTSLEPRPFLTQASDLLVRIDLSEDVEISEAIRVRVRLTPETDEQPVEFNIDGKFVGVTTLYPFIPASSIPFQRFHVQVSLIVDNVQGPFNPPHATEGKLIDMDLSMSYLAVHVVQLFMVHVHTVIVCYVHTIIIILSV